MKFEISPKSTEIQANWDDAKFYCFFLSIDGKTGWRLPTIEELTEINDSENDFSKRWYWSAVEKNNNSAWLQVIPNGSHHDINKNGVCYVRAVRDL
jgi:formylglycine-generating enzyme required for sulfatase activity